MQTCVVFTNSVKIKFHVVRIMLISVSKNKLISITHKFYTFFYFYETSRNGC